MTETLEESRTPPPLSGGFAADAAALTALARDGVTGAESLNRAREAFLGTHAGELYDVLTLGRTRRVRLEEIVYGAAERVPGAGADARGDGG